MIPGQAFIPRQHDVFAGLDVDKTSISVTFLDHENMIKSMRIPYNADHLLNYVRKHFPGQKLAFAYEAGPTGYGLYDKLSVEGYPCLVVAPSMIPSAPGDRVKTNRLDSLKIAKGLRGGQLKTIRVPGPAYRELRHLIQLRDTFVRQATSAKCRIKALLLFEGIAFPQSPCGEWTRAVMAELKRLPCHGAVRFKLDSLLSSLEFAHGQVLAATREIRGFCARDADLKDSIEYLTSIPGIGVITGTAILARIGDWRELGTVRQIAAFLGLVPRENSTGDAVRKGPITRTGDARARNKLIQGAWVAIRVDPELREFYRRIYHNHPRDIAAKKAIVAVARKMTARIHAVLTERRPYVIDRAKSSAPLSPEETTLPQGTTRLGSETNERGLFVGSTREIETPGHPALKKETHLKTV